MNPLIYHTTITSPLTSNLIKLKSSPHQPLSLQHPIRIIHLGHLLQPLQILRAISPENILPARRIAHIIERVIQTRLLGGIVNHLRGLLQPLIHNLVIRRANPLHYLRVAEVDLSRVQTEGVSAAGLRGSEPAVSNRLPVEFDERDVGAGDLGGEFRELVEEGGVDEGDSFLERSVGGCFDGAGDENVTWIISIRPYQRVREST